MHNKCVIKIRSVIFISSFSTKHRARAWISTIQEKNMTIAGLSEKDYKNPEYVAEFFSNKWIQSGKGRTCAITVCMSETNLYHLHACLYGNTTTLKAVADILFGSHVEPIMGGKKELEEYITKSGKYAESEEQVLYTLGLDNVQGKQGARSDLEEIEEMLEQGYTPQEILKTSFRYYRYEKMILSAYTNIRVSEAPIIKDILVEYHIGETGSGKSYYYVQLCTEFSPDDIYVMNDFDNSGSGGLDNYMKVGAPPILFIDEYKGELSYTKLLTMLNPYTRMETHARYSNIKNLWERVVITSVFPPEEVYRIMVQENLRHTDSYQQLLRRINKIVYHYKDKGEFKTLTIDSKEYINYTHLKSLAHHTGVNNDNPFNLTPVSDEDFNKLMKVK